MTFRTITPQEIGKLQAADNRVQLVDVRTPVEFQEVHAEGARNIPLDQIDAEKVQSLRNGSEQPLYVLCRTGSRAKKACEKLDAAGVEQLILVEGGTVAWEESGLPVLRGKKTISLERQVRILAGTLVFVGALLAIFVHPYFAAISALIGAGLVFAGLTDTCGMGMMLAKMPWNRVNCTSGSCSR